MYIEIIGLPNCMLTTSDVCIKYGNYLLKGSHIYEYGDVVFKVEKVDEKTYNHFKDNKDFCIVYDSNMDTKKLYFNEEWENIKNAIHSVKRFIRSDKLSSILG